MATTTPTNNLINTGALLRAGGIGLAVMVIIQIIGFAVGLVIGAGAAAGGVDESTAGALLGGAGIVAICGCCLSLILYGGMGAGYGWFAAKGGSPLEVGPMALGGALTAFAVGLLTGICGAGLAYAGSALGTTMASPSDPLTGAATGALAGVPAGVLGFAFQVCLYPFIFAIMGAIGGAIYASTQGNKAASTPAAA